MKNVRFWSFSGLYFPLFGLNIEKYEVNTDTRKNRPEKIQIRTLSAQCFIEHGLIEHSLTLFLKKSILQIHKFYSSRALQLIVSEITVALKFKKRLQQKIAESAVFGCPKK